jgi:cyclopropane fatty-acyl-phospholipid synthase-like methyltransferase
LDALKFTTVAHRRCDFLGPIFLEKADRLLAALELKASQRILDIGCGKGALLCRAAQNFGITGVGYDLNPTFIDDAKSRSERYDTSDRLQSVVADIQNVPIEPESFDVAICTGASHAYGTM